MEVEDIVKFQKVANYDFIHKHFYQDIEECWSLTWEDVKKICEKK